MTVWLVRAGKNGENESLALEQGLSVIGWSDIPDMSGIATREELETLCRERYPDAPQNRIRNFVGQLWAFRNRIQVGDLVVLPLKTSSSIAIGKINGPYKYRADLPECAQHTHDTEWIRTDIPRSAVDQDLLYSMGAFMTVCQITRNNAASRIQVLLGWKPNSVSTETEDVEETLDVEQYAQDQLKEFISRKFKGHDLARLVNELLRAQGYKTHVSPPGSDGGADILAGGGPMGFDPPRLCVQVKSQDSPVDVSVLRDLQGTLKNFGAEQGLLVSMGGFKSSVLSEARRVYFEIRLWDASDLVQNLLANYEKLREDTQAELPLKRIWALVPEEVE
ncbi:MAG: restriction endonuclease [Armatimonadota bacterium]